MSKLSKLWSKDQWQQTHVVVNTWTRADSSAFFQPGRQLLPCFPYLLISCFQFVGWLDHLVHHQDITESGFRIEDKVDNVLPNSSPLFLVDYWNADFSFSQSSLSNGRSPIIITATSTSVYPAFPFFSRQGRPQASL